MDVRVRELAARQHDLVAAWQLLELGWSRDRIAHWAARSGWAVLHPGVYLLVHAPSTRLQIWMGATLSAPGSVLSHASAAACSGFREHRGTFETITRPGSGGPRRIGTLLVSRSLLLPGETTTVDGIPTTTAARTIIDLSANLNPIATARCLREALRLERLTIPSLVDALDRHRGRRGTRVLWELAGRYSSIPYARTRSNAEARALEILHDANLLPDKVNAVIGGEEADLIWVDRRLIVEIDGPQYHQFREEDDRKQRRWEAAGYTVRRLSSGAVYAQPEALIALVGAPTAPASR